MSLADNLDFNRVRALIAGLTDPAKRKAEVYVSGQWERGGYLRGECSYPFSPFTSSVTKATQGEITTDEQKHREHRPHNRDAGRISSHALTDDFDENPKLREKDEDEH